MPEEIEEIFRQAQKRPLLEDRSRGPQLDRREIEGLLPHRDPFLFLDRVTALDFDNGLVAARFDLSRARDIFAGHFPGRPILPGVLQIEAVAQAGIVLRAKSLGEGPLEAIALTHVLGARYVRPVAPEGELEIVAAVRDEGMFFTVVGQCLQRGEICSASAVRGL